MARVRRALGRVILFCLTVFSLTAATMSASAYYATNLTVTPNEENTALVLTWTNPDSFREANIYRQVDGEERWDYIGYTVGNFYVDTWVELGVTYNYRVDVYDENWYRFYNSATAQGALDSSSPIVLAEWWTNHGGINEYSQDYFYMYATFMSVHEIIDIQYEYSADGTAWDSVPLAYDYGMYNYGNRWSREIVADWSGVAEGTYQVKATALDTEGNTLESVTTVVKDLVAPDSIVTDLTVTADTDTPALILTWTNPEEEIAGVVIERRYVGSGEPPVEIDGNVKAAFAAEEQTANMERVLAERRELEPAYVSPYEARFGNESAAALEFADEYWYFLAEYYTDNTYIDTDVDWEEAYEYRITVMDRGGNTSTNSAVVSAELPLDGMKLEYFAPFDDYPNGYYTDSSWLWYEVRLLDDAEIQSILFEASTDGGETWFALNDGDQTPEPWGGMRYYAYGEWDLSALSDGEYLIRVTATDELGRSKTATKRFIIDRTPPAAPVHLQAVNTSTGVTLSWDFDADAHGYYLDRRGPYGFESEWYIPGNQTTFDDTGLELGYWYTYSLRAFDRAYSWSDDAAQVSVKHFIGPEIRVDGGLDVITKNNPYTVTGQTTPGSTMVAGGTPVTVDAEGRFSFTVSLTEGYNSIEISATDADNLTNTELLTVYLDTVPPTIYSFTPYDNSVIGGKQAAIYGEAYDNTGEMGRLVFQISRDDGASWNDIGEITRSYGTYYWDATADIGGMGPLTDGAYKFRMVAYDKAGNSSNSPVRIWTIDNTAPAAPSNLRATAEEDRIRLNWDSNTETDLSSYRVYRSTGSGSGYEFMYDTWSTSLYDNVPPGTTYYYVVAAVDRAGNESGYSSEVAAEALGDVTLPTVNWYLFNEGSIVGGPSVQVRATAYDNSWRGIASTLFEISADGGENWQSLGAGYYYSWGGYYYVDWNTAGWTSGSYMFRFTAVDFSGNARSITRTVNLDVDATKPVATATPGEGTIIISWDPVPDTDFFSYTVYRAVSIDGWYYEQATMGSGTTSYTDRNVTIGQTYYYKVAFRDTRGNIAESDIVFAQPGDDLIPPVVTSVNPANGAAVGGSQVSIEVRATDNKAVTLMQAEISTDDGASWSAQGISKSSLSGPYTPDNHYRTTFTWNTNGFEEGTYLFRFTARDAKQNEVNQMATYTLDKSVSAAANVAAASDQTTIIISWDAITDSDLDSSIYRVHRGTNPGGPYTALSNWLNVTGYQDTTAVPAQTYYYVIETRDRFGNTNRSAEIAGALQEDTEPPVITEVDPANEEAVGGSSRPTLYIFFTDNNKLKGASAKFEYSADDGETWNVISGTPAGDYPWWRTDNRFYLQWDSSYESLGSGTYQIRYSVFDAYGNADVEIAEITIDKDAPQAPQNLIGSFDGTASITLRWEASADRDVSYYYIYRATSADGPFQLWSAVSGTSLTYRDTQVQTGLTYYYRVTAMDAFSQESSASNIAAAAAVADTTAPTVTGISPADGHVFGPVASASITVTAQDNLALSSITLQYSTDGGSTWNDVSTRASSGSTAFTWAIDSLSGEVKVRAIARDSRGNASDGTPVHTYTIDRKAPDAPADLTATYGTSNIVLNWTAPADTDVSYYRIYRSDSEEGPFTYLAQVNGRSNVSYTDRTAVIGRTYYYQVKATDGFSQEGAASNTAIASPNDEVPPVILGMEPAADTVLGPNANITVRAEDNLKLAGITLQYSVDGVAWTDIETKTLNSVSSTTVFVWNPAPLNGAVQLRAIAHDAAGNDSDGTPVRNYVVDTQGPAKVEGLTAEPTATGALLRWQDVPDQDFSYFRVEQKDSADGEYRSIATVSAVLGHNVTGLQPESTYWFRVVAYDKLGNRGTPSDEIVVTTVVDTQSPAVTGLSPSPGYYSTVIPLRGSATDNVGLSSMKFQYSFDGTNWTDIAEVPFVNAPKSGSVTYDWDVSALAEGTVSVRGIAKDTAGNVSTGASYVQYQIDHTAPAVPTGVAVAASAGDMMLTWQQGTETDLASYIVYRAEQESGPYEVLKDRLFALGYRDWGVEAGKTYYYKVVAVDRAGNTSEAGGPVSASLAPDTEGPVILSISPASGTLLPANPYVGVAVSDNYRIDEVKLEYQLQGAPADQWTTIAHEQNLNDRGHSRRYTWNTSGLTDGTYVIRAVASDVNGNVSAPLTTIFSLNVDAPAAPVVTAQPGGWKVDLSWTTGNESDLAGFRIYRSTTPGSGYKYLGETTGTTFTDAPLAPGKTYYYVVDALDIYRNVARSAEAAAEPTTDDPYSPTAVAGDDQVAVVGLDVQFDGTASSDNDRIASYAWDFGDGATSAEAQPTHAYASVGIYTVTLTVADPFGNTSTDTLTVEVREPQEVGTLQVRVLDDSSGAPIGGASVVIQYPDGTNQKMTTNGLGIATAAVEPGNYKVYAYKTDYKPRAADAAVTVNESTQSTVRLERGELVVGELTVNRMTLDEIIDAGIDVSAPENQFVYKFEVHLAFNNVPLPAPSEFIVNGAGQFVGGTPAPLVINTGIGGGGGSGQGTLLAHPVVIPHVDHPEVRPTVAYMVIPGEARWLKEFFNVGLTLENTADPEFIIDGSTATLKLPEGLALAPTPVPQTLTVDLGAIAGGEKRQVNWIIRGDEKGYYMLEADFNGILQPFGDAVHTVFKTKDPFRVWGEDALRMHVDAQDRADQGHPYHIRFGLENVSDIPVYNPAIELLENGKQNYIYGPNQQLLQKISELPAGETVWFDYWLIPSIEGALDLTQSYVLRTGGNAEVQTVITSHPAPENAPGIAPVLQETHHLDGTVTLTWSAVEGALGYKIYVVRDDLNMSKAAELVYVAAAGETSVTLPEPNGSKNYVMNTVSSSGEVLRHAVDWDPGLSGPAITVDPEVIPTGEETELWITVNNGGFPVSGGKVNVGTLVTDVTLDHNGQARVKVTPQSGGNIEITAYDAEGKFLISTTILAVNAVPAVPADLAATAGDGSVTLTWTANAENDIAGYNIYMNGTLIAELVQGTTYLADGLTNGQTYSFTIAAVDLAGQISPWTEAVTATPEASGDAEAPVWPIGSSLTASDITSTGVKLTWSMAEDNAGVTNYRIYQDDVLLETVASDVYGFDVSGLTPETTYIFKVEAGDAAGNWSTGGPSVTVVTTGETAPEDTESPTWLNGTVTVSNVGETSATITWSAAADNVGVTDYRIYLNNVLAASVASDVYSYELTGLVAGTLYNVKVEAGDAAGNWSSDGPTAEFTTTVTIPAATVTLTASSTTLATMDNLALTITVNGTNGTPTGTVTIYDGSRSLGTIDLVHGAAVFETTSLQGGTFNLRAVYSGDAVYASAESSEVAVTFEAAQPGPVMNYSLAEKYATTPRGVVYLAGFTLTLTPPAGMTDLQTAYRINGEGDWLAYTGPFTFGFEVFMIEYQSTDLAGNTGPIVVLDFTEGVYDGVLGTP